MSLCYCGYSETLGARLSKEQTARKPGFRCPNCYNLVLPGQRCRDFAGLDCDGGGFFYRMHSECYDLMVLASKKYCSGDWCVPFNLAEAAEEVMASEGHTEWGKAWMLLYEKTWAFGPDYGEVAEDRRQRTLLRTCGECIKLAYCQSHGKVIYTTTRACPDFEELQGEEE